jgi:hypothetical protein
LRAGSFRSIEEKSLILRNFKPLIERIYHCVLNKFVYAGKLKGGIYMKFFAFVLAMLLVAGMAFAADIDGKWAGELDMGGQKIPVEYTFKADGATLTGSTQIMDSPVTLKDGKINGNNISFSINFGEGEQAMKIDYKGVLTGDTLKLTFDMMGQSTDIVLKKAK